ncbi:aliphatic nitrilase [Fusarium pseudoanthophilum]|uniref:Aliphatic nitrilase n=1 Tax=Fusarium pseudoanthophilum TaxID=48495 RepID=A0A8H5UXT9_9HYPO|nr:aliphatic nitrilase [Fusarium pseudoanthophilum]
MRFQSIISLGLLASGVSSSALPRRDYPVKLNDKGYYDHLDPANFTVATVVKSPFEGAIPVDLFNEPQSLPQKTYNIDIATKRAVSFIHEAAADGVGMLVFSEVWFPGYPFWLMTHAPNVEQTQDYINNSIVEGDANWKALVKAVKTAGIYVAIGASERIGDALHMSQVLWSPEGEKLIHRQKLRASNYERNLWSDGSIDGFKVVSTPYGRIGMLECWEHLHAQMFFPMQAQLEDIHIAMYPNIGDPWEIEDPAKITGPFASSRVNMAGVHVYSATAKVWSFVAGTGGSLVLNRFGAIQSFMAPPKKRAMGGPSYHAYSLNTTGFRNRTYEVNNQFGYGSLLEMLQSYPSYIPKDRGTWIEKKVVTIKQLLKRAAKGPSYFQGDDTAEGLI